jgi:hypothetical protein
MRTLAGAFSRGGADRASVDRRRRLTGGSGPNAYLYGATAEPTPRNVRYHY